MLTQYFPTLDIFFLNPKTIKTLPHTLFLKMFVTA